MSDFEKLGAFYLGRTVDSGNDEATEDLLLYDAKDLTTHALCVGMTGSGKTGLCIGILEEAAIDNIPAIVIDPKGDIGNLLLTFPSLLPSDFRPWIDEGEALRKGLTPDDFAKKTADLWKNGLAEWGQAPARISRFKDAVDVAIYTPGSTAGLPLSILGSFSAPPAELLADSDGLRDRILSAVSGLLGLLGIEADPIQSREHILLSNILSHSWKKGIDLGLPDLIRLILDPPFETLGVFGLETFFPSTDRQSLAMRLNNVLASPSFSAWIKGETMDIEKLLYTPEGKARISILSIAHLSDAERMFFVTLLLNETVSWMRQQSGTSSLRALLYMDEIFGFFPPTANPPSKIPMLTLLKQARAYGLGCILATQNPVDLDYKGLGNTGTWFIGRLQTERDKLRVLDGLEGASASAGMAFQRSEIDRLLSGLGKRVFLMNNVHDDGPVLFQTRWVLSYLRGPLTRDHIDSLMKNRKRLAEANERKREAAGSEATPELKPTGVSGIDTERGGSNPRVQVPPVLPSSIKPAFFRAKKDVPEDGRLVYRPALLANVRLHFVNARAKLDSWEKATILAPVSDNSVGSPWERSVTLESGRPESSKRGLAGAEYADLPGEALKVRSYSTWKTKLKTHVYRNNSILLRRCAELKMLSQVGESEGEFRVRVGQQARERRDLALEKLKKTFVTRFDRLRERIRKAEQRVDRETSQYERSRRSVGVSVGSTLLGALMGRKAASLGSIRRAASSLNRAGGAMKEREDIALAEQDVETARDQLAEMEIRFQEETAKLQDRFPTEFEFEDLVISPRKADIEVSDLTLAWTPWSVDRHGIARPIF